MIGALGPDKGQFLRRRKKGRRATGAELEEDSEEEEMDIILYFVFRCVIGQAQERGLHRR